MRWITHLSSQLSGFQSSSALTQAAKMQSRQYECMLHNRLPMKQGAEQLVAFQAADQSSRTEAEQAQVQSFQPSATVIACFSVMRSEQYGRRLYGASLVSSHGVVHFVIEMLEAHPGSREGEPSGGGASIAVIAGSKEGA